MNVFTKGLCFGSGFAIGLVLLGTLSLCGISKIQAYRNSNDSDFRTLKSRNVAGTDIISVLEYRTEFSNGNCRVLGSIKNNTNTSVTAVMVQASVFSDTGKFLDKSFDFFNSISSGETVGFKIKFKNGFLPTNVAAKVCVTQGYVSGDKK